MLALWTLWQLWPIAVSSAGHQATVFEFVSQLHETGAGMQVTPNGSRLLNRWGEGDLLNQMSRSLLYPEFSDSVEKCWHSEQDMTKR